MLNLLMLKLLVRCFPKIIFPEVKGMDASKENSGESIKPRVLLKSKCSQGRLQKEVFLGTLVCVHECVHVQKCEHRLHYRDCVPAAIGLFYGITIRRLEMAWWTNRLT